MTCVTGRPVERLPTAGSPRPPSDVPDERAVVPSRGRRVRPRRTHIAGAIEYGHRDPCTCRLHGAPVVPPGSAVPLSGESRGRRIAGQRAQRAGHAVAAVATRRCPADTAGGTVTWLSSMKSSASAGRWSNRVGGGSPGLRPERKREQFPIPLQWPRTAGCPPRLAGVNVPGIPTTVFHRFAKRGGGETRSGKARRDRPQVGGRTDRTAPL